MGRNWFGTHRGSTGAASGGFGPELEKKAVRQAAMWESHNWSRGNACGDLEHNVTWASRDGVHRVSQDSMVGTTAKWVVCTGLEKEGVTSTSPMGKEWQ